MARKVVVLISDGENAPPLLPQGRQKLLDLATRFKTGGGIVICIGIRAAGNGFRLLRSLASGGFFLNVYGGKAEVDTAIQNLLCLTGAVCASAKPPAGYGYTCAYFGGSAPAAQASDPEPLPNFEAMGLKAPALVCS